MGKPLTFKPDKLMGEGEATPEELSYRQDLLDLLGRLYKVVGKRFKTITNPSDLIRKIDSDVNDFISEGQQVVLNHIPKTRNNSQEQDRKSTRRNASHITISYAVFCVKKKKPHGCPPELHPQLGSIDCDQHGWLLD